MKQILLLLLFSFCRWETNSEMASGWPKVTLLSAERQVLRSIQTLVCPSPEPTLHFSTLYGNQVVSARFFQRNVSWSHQSWSYSQATSPLPIFLLKLISLAPWFPWIQTFPIRNIIKSSSVKKQCLLNWARTNLQWFSMRATLPKVCLGIVHIYPPNWRGKSFLCARKGTSQTNGVFSLMKK